MKSADYAANRPEPKLRSPQAEPTVVGSTMAIGRDHCGRQGLVLFGRSRQEEGSACSRPSCAIFSAYFTKATSRFSLARADISQTQNLTLPPESLTTANGPVVTLLRMAELRYSPWP